MIAKSGGKWEASDVTAAGEQAPASDNNQLTPNNIAPEGTNPETEDLSAPNVTTSTTRVSAMAIQETANASDVMTVRAKDSKAIIPVQGPTSSGQRDVISTYLYAQEIIAFLIKMMDDLEERCDDADYELQEHRDEQLSTELGRRIEHLKVRVEHDASDYDAKDALDYLEIEFEERLQPILNEHKRLRKGLAAISVLLRVYKRATTIACRKQLTTSISPNEEIEPEKDGDVENISASGAVSDPPREEEEEDGVDADVGVIVLSREWYTRLVSINDELVRLAMKTGNCMDNGDWSEVYEQASPLLVESASILARYMSQTAVALPKKAKEAMDTDDILKVIVLFGGVRVLGKISRLTKVYKEKVDGALWKDLARVQESNFYRLMPTKTAPEWKDFIMRKEVGMYSSLICHPPNHRNQMNRVPRSVLLRLLGSQTLGLSNYVFEIKFAFPRCDPPVFVDFEFGNWYSGGDRSGEIVEEFSFVVDGNSALLTENGLCLKASYRGDALRLDAAARDSGCVCIPDVVDVETRFGKKRKCDINIIAVNKTTTKIASLVDGSQVRELTFEHLDNGNIKVEGENFDVYRKGQSAEQVRIGSTFQSLMTTEHIEFRMKHFLKDHYIGSYFSKRHYDNKLLGIILEELD